MTEPIVCTCAQRDGCCLLCVHLHPGRKANHPETPWGCCGDCRLRLAAIPGELAEAFVLLPELILPGAHGGDGRSKNPEAPLPLVVDPLDLTADRALPTGPIALERLAANADLQIGHLPVAMTLWNHVRIWADLRGLGEVAHADATVYHMCRWLRERTEWACDHHPSVDEYAAEMQSLRGLLFDLVGRPEPDERPKALPGIPCPRCRHVPLSRYYDDQRETWMIQCGWENCNSRWTEEEYTVRSKAMAVGVRRGQIKREDVA